MKDKNSLSQIMTHLLLIIGLMIILSPIYFALVASTHHVSQLISAPLPMWFGNQALHNYYTVLVHGAEGGQPVARMLLNSLIMALIIALGKIILALLAAFSFVYFRFPGRRFFFILIFATLMLPVQVRIVPTFEVTARLDMINTFSGLTLPLLASATATFLFRQFFMTVPPELMEAATLDGAGPCRFFFSILLPLSKTNIAALFVVLFIYGWNQFLWPLVTTTSSHLNTIVMGMQQLAATADQVPQWNLVMATAILGLLPPLLIMLIMQRWFVKGLVETEK